MNFGDLELDKKKSYTLRGVIVFFDYATGSKSESVRPFLYKNAATKIRLFKKGDNPFKNESLLPFDGKMVEVSGAWERGDAFYVTEIKEI